MKQNNKKTPGPLDGLYDFSILRDLRKREQMNIQEVARLSSVSPAVISKLERNQSSAELTTLFRLSRVFGMNTTDLLTLAECRTSHKTKAESHVSGGFTFQEIRYANVRCLLGTAKAGDKTSRPEVHQDDYELAWVLKGSVSVSLPAEKHELKSGDAIQFDAVLCHSYEALEDSEMLILHLKKAKRF
ncbi:MAG: XRE family transcriptional regulator [Verrucomicrobiae bacterium]|nr:XRE family transcriptional regulator [Verrucomicrobiae bacterium]